MLLCLGGQSVSLTLELPSLPGPSTLTQLSEEDQATSRPLYPRPMSESPGNHGPAAASLPLGTQLGSQRQRYALLEPRHPETHTS